MEKRLEIAVHERYIIVNYFIPWFFLRGATHNRPASGQPGRKNRTMKHLLPILTAALALTAATASASNYYYDYYLNPPHPEKPARNQVSDDYYNENDSFTYGTRDNSGAEITNPDVFIVNRESNWNNSISRYADKNNFFRIDLGKENANDMTLYLTDFVSEVFPQGPYNSSSNAIFNMDIVEYGYRTLTLDAETGKYIAGDTVTRDVFVSDGENNKVLNTKYITPIDSIQYTEASEPVVRYKYELGTFSSGDIIEVYMKDSEGREVYSFSSIGSDKDGEAVYTPFDRNAPSDDVAALGGFGDGGYTVNPIQIDKMLYSYYFVEEINGQPNEDYHDYTKFDTDLTLASGKAMPLSQLIPTTLNNEGFAVGGKAVAFGIYGVTAVGSPLPGGLSMALIAGFFGLGFCYVRRRKAIAV